VLHPGQRAARPAAPDRRLFSAAVDGAGLPCGVPTRQHPQSGGCALVGTREDGPDPGGVDGRRDAARPADVLVAQPPRSVKHAWQVSRSWDVYVAVVTVAVAALVLVSDDARPFVLRLASAVSILAFGGWY